MWYSTDAGSRLALSRQRTSRSEGFTDIRQAPADQGILPFDGPHPILASLPPALAVNRAAMYMLRSRFAQRLGRPALGQCGGKYDRIVADGKPSAVPAVAGLKRGIGCMRKPGQPFAARDCATSGGASSGQTHPARSHAESGNLRSMVWSGPIGNVADRAKGIPNALGLADWQRRFGQPGHPFKWI